MARILERLRKLRSGDELAEVGCQHKDQIRDVEPSADGCGDCLKNGDRWVHLRMCLTCGYSGCCDSSRNKHARKHAHRTEHPLITSQEPGEDWVYCFVDDETIFPE
jgi:uncharacterized UBP type Zn finger protein